MEKKEVPQLTAQGVSGDYSNETTPLLNIVNSYERGIDNWANARPLKKYEERYPPSEYIDVVTGRNREIIRKIDLAVDEINMLLFRKSKDAKKYERIINMITFLTYGKK